MKKLRFNVSNKHILLLTNMQTSWNDKEYGAPSIDPKRPYGNKNVAHDMTKILGMSPPEDTDEWCSGEEADELSDLHNNTEVVLQILLHNCQTGISPGIYVKDEYGGKWIKEAS